MSIQKSEFNMGLNYLEKINFLLWQSTAFSISLDVYEWFLVLKALKRTIITEIEENDLTEFKMKEKEITKEIMMFNKKHQKIASIPPSLYEHLEDYEIKIYRILRKAGILNKIKESASSVIGQGEKW